MNHGSEKAAGQHLVVSGGISVRWAIFALRVGS